MKEPFDYENDKGFQQADKYAKKFTPKDDVDYTWVWEYAREDYVRLVEAKDRIEKKADAIINYFGAFGGLLVIIFVYASQAAHWSIALAVLPTLFCCVAAMKQAIAARAPLTVPTPPEIRNAIGFAEEYGELAQATFIPRFAAASKGMEAVNRDKARLVNSANALLIWAMALLSLPLFAGIIYAMFFATATTVTK